MHPQDGPCSIGDLRLHIHRIQREGVVDVGEDRHAIVQQQPDDAAAGCPGGDDNLISGVRVDGADTGVQGRRARIDSDAVLGAVPLGERLFEFVALVGFQFGTQHLGYGFNVGFAVFVSRTIEGLRPHRCTTVDCKG